MKFAPVAVALFVIAPFTACTDPVGVATDATVAIELSGNGLLARNRSDERIYFVAVNPRALLLWTPCIDNADTCQHIDARASTTIGFDQILGWQDDPSAERVAFNYYHLIKEGSRWRPDVIRTVTVTR